MTQSAPSASSGGAVPGGQVNSDHPTTTIQNVQINVQNNFSIKQSNLSQYGQTVVGGAAANGTGGAGPGQAQANGMGSMQPGAVGQVASANSWNMPPVNNSAYPSQMS